MVPTELLDDFEASVSIKEPQQKFGCIIVGDNFDKTFRPLLADAPWVRQKLCGVHLLDLIIKAVARTPVTNVVIMSRHFSKELIQEYDTKYKRHFWNIKFAENEHAANVGDVIREVRQRDLMDMDFLLIPNILTLLTGDFVQEIQDFVGDRLTRKDHIITCLGVQSYEYKDIFKINPTNGKVENFFNEHSRSVKLTKADFINGLQFSSSLKPLPIWVCGRELFSMFITHFDLSGIEDLMRYFIANDEIEGKYCRIREISKESYVVSANSYYEWMELQSKFIRSFFYPLRPEIAALENNMCVKLLQLPHSVYVGHDKVDLSFKVHKVINKRSRRSFVGFVPSKTDNLDLMLVDTSIVEIGNLVKSSSFTKCMIGKHFESGVQLNLVSAIIGDRVKIEEGCKIGKNVYIGDDIVIPRDTILADCSIVLSRAATAQDKGYTSKPFGKNYLWTSSSEIFSIIYSPNRVNKPSHRNLFVPRRERRETQREDDELDATDHIADNSANTEQNCIDVFANEIAESMKDLAESENCFDDTRIQTLKLEINSSKMAYKIHKDDVCSNVMGKFLQLEQCRTAASCEKMIKGWLPLLTNYFKKEDTQKLIIPCIEEIAKNSPANDVKMFRTQVKIIHALYEVDILNEDLIIGWYESLNETSPWRKHAQPLYDFLNADTDEESSEEESD
uniref:EIF-2B GDP-GTP exchange factor subunit epsilon n=1 Tax=Rhabditophanes sp. KR3021 TaxID=114890 RepID=A0AC35TFS7_9BILA